MAMLAIAIATCMYHVQRERASARHGLFVEFIFSNYKLYKYVLSDRWIDSIDRHACMRKCKCKCNVVNDKTNR